jgi:hypothetical protein
MVETAELDRAQCRRENRRAKSLAAAQSRSAASRDDDDDSDSDGDEVDEDDEDEEDEQQRDYLVELAMRLVRALVVARRWAVASFLIRELLSWDEARNRCV